MKVVVTGGAGFIGSHLVDALVERGHQVKVVDDLSSGQLSVINPRANFHRVDIRAAEAGDLVREWGPDVICHLAAQMSVSRSVREPLFDAEVNVLGALRLLEAARDVNARVVFASSGGALYGDADMLPTPESCPPLPVSPYAVSKLAFEHYLRSYRAQYGLSYLVLRFGNVYGPRQNPHGEAGVVAIFCQRLLQGLPVVINGDGRYTRDYVYVDDVVEANLAAIDSPVVGHYNVGTGRQVDVNQLFHLVASRLGVDAEELHGPHRAGDVRASALDSSLIATDLGWHARVPLEDGLEKTLAWFRKRVPAQAAAAIRG